MTDTSTMARATPLDGALWLVRHGFAVFPADHPGLVQCAGIGRGHDSATCTDRGKHPSVPFTKAHTLDEDQVRRDFDSGQYRNVGVYVGGCSGPNGEQLLVVDSDRPGAIEDAARTLGQQHTPTMRVHTAKGYHDYYWAPAGAQLGNRLGALQGQFDGDVRGGNAFVIGPGSVHATGVTYELEDADQPPVALPEWLLTALQARATPAPAAAPTAGIVIQRDRHDAYTRKVLQAEADAIAAAPDGDQNNAINRASFNVGTLVGAGALSEGEARQTLLAAARAGNHPEGRAHAAIDSGLSAGIAQPRNPWPPVARADSWPAASDFSALVSTMVTPPLVAAAADGQKTPPEAEAPVAKAIMRSWDDIGNAQRLLDRYASILRWTLVKKGGEWGVYDGKRWAFYGGDTLVRTLARKTIEDLPDAEAGLYSDEPQYDAAGKEKPSQKEQFLAFVAKMRDHRPMGRAIASAATFPEIHARAEDFDANRRYLNLPNGVLDTDTVQLVAHDPALMLSKMFATSYNPDATAPTWERFLEMNLPDAATRVYLQKAAGYTLSGLSNEKTLLYLHGPSDTGKSIFTGVMGRMFGTEYGIAASDGALAPRRDGAINNNVDDMAGKRFVTTSESRPGEEMDEALVKRLTGRDEQRSRALYENNRSWIPECVIWVCSNQYPKITGDDDAIWTRIRVIPFLRQFLAGDPERDERLEEKLHKEIEGILAWAVRGLAMYLRDGLAPPPEVVQAGEKFRAAADGVAAFVAEYAEDEFLTVEEHGWAPRSDIYEMYQRWCGADSLRMPLRPSRFYTRMETSYRPAKVNGTRGFKGISLGPKGLAPVGWGMR